ACSVEREFLKREELFGKAVLPFEDLEKSHPPDEFEIYVAMTYTQMNRVRMRNYAEAKRKGYRCATYISSRAFVWPNVTIGENCFIFEANVIQYRATLGNNVVLWSGNHIGHRAVIHDHVFLSSHGVVSGYCEIGESCFLGVNSALGDRVKVAADCVIGAGAVVLKDTQRGQVYRGNPAVAASVGSLRLFNVKETGAAGGDVERS